MRKFGKTWKTISLSVMAVAMTGTLVASQIAPLWEAAQGSALTATEETPLISEVKGGVDLGLEQYFDSEAVSKKNAWIDDDREVSYIVKTTGDSLLSSYQAQAGVSRYTNVADYAVSAKGRQLSDTIGRKNGEASTLLEKSGVKFRYGADYGVLVGGFEIVAKAGDYERLSAALSSTGYSITISEEYAVAETEPVVNDVNVQDTGIFDSSESDYDGSGTLIAVLDTGLDYTHSAFSVDRFHPKEGSDLLEQSEIAACLSDLRASELRPGLTAASVYYNAKVPYMFDYADGDEDVYPLESEHGTHVSGVIVGKDAESNKEGITGVAPNAQLASMKVFSDTTTGARWSWILAALEDCVVLGVDVINMSLGSSAGFSEESREDQSVVYERIADAGISLVAAASNDFNSTYGSEKNGNLGLTTNPDSATVGSPGSYTSSLAVASISGVRTPYLTYKGEIMYFTEASDQSSEPKNFVDDILPDNVEERYFDYVRISGTGGIQDYEGVDIEGKIALVRRGTTTFEEKARAAEQMGAAGVIIYNNVSGNISMTVGAAKIAVCSMSQDNGEILAQAGSGQIFISRKQVAGPFMSDFSSWGPTPDLRIKPEITAHGGEIYSAVPGQRYDRLSGTSMASPNQAGVTALVRQYVEEKFPDIAGNPVAVMARANQLMMSTADIAYNVNNLPYSVRKQGSGLANLTKTTSTPAYISAFARDDDAVANQSENRFSDTVIDKAKIEYGDDKAKSGNYLLKFNINNVQSSPLTYNVGAIVMTEGVAETPTHQGDLTVTEEGYELKPETIAVESISGSGTQDGNKVTVNGNGTVTVSLRITLSDADRDYLNKPMTDSDGNLIGRDVFENGMYIEGFVTLKPVNGTEIPLNVPYLAFYGDWTQAPMFDLDYFETDKDARDDSIDLLDKTLPDAYATMPIGGLYNDYIYRLGSFYFIQDPSAAQVSADRSHIALTNQEGETGGVNSIADIYAGMLRGAKRIEMSITDTSTGNVIWTKTVNDQRKSHGSGSTIYPSSVDVDFHVADYDLKNNTQYLFRMEGYLDYPGEQKNKKSTFEFPFTADFQAPIVTDAEFYTEYDTTLKKNRLFARISIYDNHYAMSASFGTFRYADPDSEYTYTIDRFTQYPTPVFSSLGGTTTVRVELTDYIPMIHSALHPNTFTVQATDYALNTGVYEIRIPDSVQYLYFSEMEGVAEGTDKEYGVTLSPNQTFVLEPKVFPATEWKEALVYRSDNESVVKELNGKLVAVAAGTATVTAQVIDNPNLRAELTVKVLEQGEPGYQFFSKTVVDNFVLTGYHADKVYYFMGTDDRDLGLTGYDTLFSRNATRYELSMFPSEQVTLLYDLFSFDEENTLVTFSSGSERYARVSETGQITAVAEGRTTITVSVKTVNADNTISSTMFDKTIIVNVKNPYERNGPYLVGYRGGGGENGVVEIPEELGFTEISQYAFTGYDYIPKDLSAGDVITEEDPLASKIWYYGENQDVKEVHIPEGVEVIGNYAFAGMKGLEKVYLPKSLKKIAAGAFYGCNNLNYVYGLENVQFINQSAFWGPAVGSGSTLSYEAAPLTGLGRDENNKEINSFASIVAIGDHAFRNTNLTTISLPKSAQSIGAYAFAGSTLMEVKIEANKIKLGQYAFTDCTFLDKLDPINASVIPEGAFANCTALTTVTLGADVESIGTGAFGGSGVTTFRVSGNNSHFAEQNSGAYLLSKDGSTLLYVAPAASRRFEITDRTVTTIADSAFAGHDKIISVNIPSVVNVGDRAFLGCTSLGTITLGTLQHVGTYAFAGTAIDTMPQMAGETANIADYAFAQTDISTVTLGNNAVIGEGAFFGTSLTSLTIGDNATIGRGAFQPQVDSQELTVSNTNYTYLLTNSRSTLSSVKIGANAKIGSFAFSYLTALTKVELGSGAEIGDHAFYNSATLTVGVVNREITITARSEFSIDLAGAKSVGEGAFSGDPVFIRSEGYLVGVSGWQAPQVKKVDLTAATVLGASAFAYSTSVEELILGEGITEIPDFAFTYSPIKNFSFANVKKIGESAFSQAAITEADLSKVDEIADRAFNYCEELQKVTLKEGAVVGSEAFYSNMKLAQVNGIGGVHSIGDRAFAETALAGEIDLGAAYSLGSFAFAHTDITKVKLSDSLFHAERAEGETDEAYKARVFLGDNPFAGCPLEPFVLRTETSVNGGGYIQTEDNYDFAINEMVQVIGGVLYKLLPNGGLELVCYPAASEARSFTAADGTVRIAAEAFEGCKLSAVTLPDTVKTIGDKAFFDANSLRMVTFCSLRAPILEEQYDTEYASMPLYDENRNVMMDNEGRVLTHLVGDPGYRIFTRWEKAAGLGITKYVIYSFDPVNVLFGATFVGRVGYFEGDLVMVRPRNGTGYDSFMYGQYFDMTVDGAAAPDDITKAAIEAIRALPEAAVVTLADEEKVVAARALYDQIVLAEQKGLVEGGYDGVNYYAKLTEVEHTIEYLKMPNQPVDPVPPEKSGGADPIVITLSVLVGVFGAAAIAAFVLLFITKKKGGSKQ